MPQIALTPGHLARPRLGLPAISAVNCILEKTPGGPTPDVRTSRPGNFSVYNVGTGPIFRVYQEAGNFSGTPFMVSGAQAYWGSTLLGSVPYSEAPRFASGQGFLALVVGGALYIYDGTNFTLQSTFDDHVSILPPFSSVVVLYNVWLFSVQNSNKVFFSSVGNPSVINAANYFSAQTSPTPIIEMAILGEEAYFFKASNGVEIWDYTGQLTAPFAESPGRTYARGCTSQNSVVQLDNSLFWVGDDYTVYRTGTVPQRVSTSLIEDRLTACSEMIAPHNFPAFTFSLEGHVYYVLNLPPVGETYAYDCQTQQWFRWGTQLPQQEEPGIFYCQCGTGQGNQIYMGSSVDGNVYSPDPRSHSDNGAAMRVVVGGAHWMTEGVMRFNNLALQLVRGVATTTIPAPTVAFRASYDGGRTWSSWDFSQDIGPVGGYRWKASWHSLGLIRQPGIEIEFAIWDAVNVTIESATINPARR